MILQSLPRIGCGSQSTFVYFEVYSKKKFYCSHLYLATFFPLSLSPLNKLISYFYFYVTRLSWRYNNAHMQICSSTYIHSLSHHQQNHSTTFVTIKDLALKPDDLPNHIFNLGVTLDIVYSMGLNTGAMMCIQYTISHNVISPMQNSPHPKPWQTLLFLTIFSALYLCFGLEITYIWNSSMSFCDLIANFFWILWQNYGLNHQKVLNVLNYLYDFVSMSAENGSFSRSVSSPTFNIVSVSDFGHSNICVEYLIASLICISSQVQQLLICLFVADISLMSICRILNKVLFRLVILSARWDLSILKGMIFVKTYFKKHFLPICGLLTNHVSLFLGSLYCSL